MKHWMPTLIFLAVFALSSALVGHFVLGHGSRSLLVGVSLASLVAAALFHLFLRSVAGGAKAK